LGRPLTSGSALAGRGKHFLDEENQSMSHLQSYEAMEADYGTDTFRRAIPIKLSKSRRPTHGRRRGKTPQSVNGMHRRRNRKICW
jgi:hypothetical protein